MSEPAAAARPGAPTRLDRVAGVAAVLFSAGVAALYVTPKVLDPDEAIVGGIARRMMELHLPVYAAGWDHKPPLLFWIYRLLFETFGAYDYLAVHVASAVAWIATGCVVGAAAAKLLGARGFAPAVVAYTLLRSMTLPSLHAGFAGAANFEAFASPLLAAAVLLLLVPQGGVRAGLAGGALLAAAAMMKPQVGVFGVVAVAANAILRGRAAAWRTAWTGLAGAIVVVGAVALALRVQGDLAGAWKCNVEMQLAYASYGRMNALGPRLAKLASLMAAEPAPWTYVACAAVAAIAFPARLGASPPVARRWAVVLAALISCGLFLVTQGGYFFRHYWWMVHPFMAVAVAAGWVALVTWPPRRAAEWTGLAAAVAVGVVLWLPRHREDKRHLASDLRRDYFGRTELAPVAEAIGRLTPAREPIWIWGWDPQLYVAADRTPATRFIACYSLTGSLRWDVASGAVPPQPDFVPGAWDLLIADLDAEKPAVIVDTSGADYFGWPFFPVAAFPRLAGYLAAHYERADEVRGFVLYRRTTP